MAANETTVYNDEYDKRVENILQSYHNSPDSLISILQDIQSEYQYLPEDSIRHVAEKLELPLIQVYGVATFFKAFSLTPRGEHTVSVCLGTACHVRGAPAVLDELERHLGVASGETTSDMQFTLESVNCLGACALGPIVVIDGKYYGQMNAGKVNKILSSYKRELRQEEDEKVKVSG